MRGVQLFLEGEWTDGADVRALEDKYTGESIAEIHEASRDQVDRSLAALAELQQRSPLTPHDRYRVLAEASRLLVARRDEAIRVVVQDSGFTHTDAAREVDRAAETLLLSGEEAKRLHGEVVPLSGAPGWNGRLAFTTLHPLGVVCAITPFNSPLNTVCHKVGPAIAAGNAVVLKPATYTPLSAAFLVQLLLDAGLPAGLISLLNGGGSTVGQWLLESQVPAFYAFTGSTEVGEHIRATVGLRRSQLELGSLSSTIVCEDADLDHCVPLCANAAFRKAGQVCTSVQRLYVHEAIGDEFARRLTALLGDRKVGDPADPETFVGPVISEQEALRIESWIADARRAGASVLHGGERSGRVITPTVLSDVSAPMDVFCREIFGPVVTIRPYRELPDAIDDANDTPYGLAAGIFTADLGRALDAAQRLRMGSIHINQTSSSRVDLQPYGGVKASGLGLEGPKYAVAEMSEQRLITIGRP